MGTPPFRLRTFGGASLESRDGAAISGFSAQRKAIALLALLAAAGSRGLSRDKLLARLWPESDTEQARNALYNLLFRVRRVLGNEAIVGTAELTLESTVVSSDLGDFNDAVSAGALERAASLYAGPYLDGFFLKEAPEFERWSADERARLARIHLEVLEGLANAAKQAGDRAAATRWWRRRTDAEPLSARGALGYIDALVAAGDRESALSFASLYSRLIREELGTEPDSSVLRRVAQLRQNPRAASVSEASAVQGSSEEQVVAQTEPIQRRLPVGAWLRRRPLIAVAGGCALVAIVITAQHAATTTLDNRRVLVAAFDNQSRDSTLDLFGRIAADGITELLAQTGLVKVVDPATALATSHRIRDSVPQLGSPAALQMLSRTTQAGLVVSGSYFRDGADLVVRAWVTDLPRNEVLAAIEPVRGPITDRGAIVDAIRQRVVGALALRLDERLATIIPHGLSPRYEAYESFIAGLEIFTRGFFDQARPYFARAYALDTTFAEPLIWEAFAAPRAARDSIARILEQHRASLSQIDRHALDYHEATVFGAFVPALEAARKAASLAPRSHWTHNVAMTLANLGRTEEAIDVWASLDRDRGWVASFPGFWIDYTRALHVAGRHREELRIAHEGHRALPANLNLQMNEAIALAINGDWDQFEKSIRDIEQRHEAGWELKLIASELHLHGDDVHSRQIYERAVRAVAAAVAQDPKLIPDLAETFYAAGRWSDAGPVIDSLRTAYPRNREWVLLAALIHARTGQRARAIAVLDSLVATAEGPSAAAQFFDAGRLAAVLGLRDRAIDLVQRSPGRTTFRHYTFYASDFDSLKGYAPFERLTAGR